MTNVTLGRTGITVNKNGFGALPIQRITKDEAAKLLRKAYDNGINLFDTARAYSDSEEKIGYALSDIRNHITITTKTMAKTADAFWKDLETSLTLLKTDHIDVYQFHKRMWYPMPTTHPSSMPSWKNWAILSPKRRRRQNPQKK